MSSMLKRRGIKQFLAIFGLLALFVTGYTATSVVTSCEAEAQVCCNTMCISPYGGVAASLGTIFAAVIVPDMSYMAIFALPAYYAQATLSFSVKVVNEIGKVTSHWDNWWDTFWNYNFSPALRDMTKQLATLNADQARAIGSFNDMMDRQRSFVEKQHQQIVSRREQAPSGSVCAQGTATGGMVRAAAFSRAYNTVAPVEAGDRSRLKAGTPAAAGTAADASARFQNYCSRYAMVGENGGASGCVANGAFPLADLDVTGQVFEKETVPITDGNTHTTIADLVTNIAEPVVLNPLPKSTLNTALGVQRYQEYQSYKAQRQVVYDMLYFVPAQRIEGSGTSTAIKEMRTAAGLPTGSNNPSMEEVLKTIAVDQYRTGRNSVDMVGDPENAKRQLAMQEGAKLMIMSRLLDLTDREAMGVAGSVSLQVMKMGDMGSLYSQLSLP